MTKSIPTNAGEPRLLLIWDESPEHTIATKPTVMGIPLIVSEQVDGDAVYLCFPTHNIKA